MTSAADHHPDSYDVIVVGGGHAGTEAAAAAARCGARTLLLTQNIETIGQMSCNPAIGGIGKSHLVAEIDALDGLMAKATDRAGIHFKTLNGSKGPAVRATRAQADRALYRSAVRELLENQSGLRIFQQSVVDVLLEGGRITGVVTEMGLTFRCRAMVLTTGTFLGGLIHVGNRRHAGGRAGDAPSNALADKLRALPFRVGRLKTGTPPRIDGRTINYANLAEEPGEDPRPVMSLLGSRDEHPRQVSCFVTRTNPDTHAIITENIGLSAMYSGAIEGVGPRYCPSVEDKVVRFADKATHQIFIEPEGLGTHEIYPNGISTSLPFDVQLQFVRTIEGFEQAHITRPGYAIEYDFFDPRDLQHSLETRAVGGLFFAGQINGTTGYEEAGAQGLLAGLNAARQVAGEAPWEPRRDEAYLGVMVDDLITLGTTEPYRMFTSRAEYRLRLRQDNADQRLTDLGHSLGVVGAQRHGAYQRKLAALDAGREQLRSLKVSAGNEVKVEGGIKPGTTAMELLRRPAVTIDDLVHTWPQLADSVAGEQTVLKQLEIEIKYEGYIRRQDEEIEKIRRHESLRLPADFDYAAVEGLSNELKQKLAQAQPATLARAARIPGMTPAALSLLLVRAKRAGQAVTG